METPDPIAVIFYMFFAVTIIASIANILTIALMKGAENERKKRNQGKHGTVRLYDRKGRTRELQGFRKAYAQKKSV